MFLQCKQNIKQVHQYYYNKKNQINILQKMIKKIYSYQLYNQIQYIQLYFQSLPPPQMEQNIHSQTNTNISSNDTHGNHIDEVQNRQLGSNYSTQANLSSQNDLKYEEMQNYCQPISDFNQIQEETQVVRIYQEILVRQKEGNYERPDNQSPPYIQEQFEFNLRQKQQQKDDGINQEESNKSEDKVYEKMDIIQIDENGQEKIEHYQILDIKNDLLLTQGHEKQEEVLKKQDSNSNRYETFLYKQRYQDKHEQNEENQEESNRIIMTTSEQELLNENNDFLLTQPQENDSRHNNSTNQDKKKVHFSIQEVQDQSQVKGKGVIKQFEENQQKEGLNKEEKPMELEYINGQPIKQAKSEYSEPPKSFYHNSNKAEYATSADKQSIQSGNIQDKPIIRGKISTNHVSIQVEMSLSGKPTKKYKGNVNILKGKTTYKRSNEEKEQSDYSNFDQTQREKDVQNQIKEERRIKQKPTKKIEERSIQSKKKEKKIASSNEKSLATKSPFKNLAKLIDQNNHQDNLGSKYTWFLKDNDQMKPNKSKSKSKGKQIIQRRTSQRLSQKEQTDLDPSQSLHSSDISYETNSNAEESLHFNIGKQSLRTKKRIQPKSTKKSRKKSVNKSVKKQINKSKAKRSVPKHEEQVDIDYIKRHMKQINVRSLMLQHGYRPLTQKDEMITELLLQSTKKNEEESRQSDSLDDQPEMEMKREAQIREEIKREEEDGLQDHHQHIEFHQKQQQDNHNNNNNALIHQSFIHENTNNQIDVPETISAQRRSTERQLTLQESFSHPRVNRKPKLKQYKPKDLMQVKRVVNPNINNHGIYALLQLTGKSQFLFKFKYVLMPITNLSKAKGKLIDEDYQKAQQLVQKQQKDNLAYLPLTLSILNLIQKEATKRRSQ